MATEALAAPGADAKRGAIWTRSFLAMCFAIFLAYGHYGLLTPSIPLYLHRLGISEAAIGLALAGFSITAVCVRPFVGYWTDTWSVVGMAGLGLLILGGTSALFLLPSVGVIVAANALRGVGWAGTNTGGNTLLAHIAPPDRRGEASGYYSMFQSGATALFPFCALWLLDSMGSGFGVVFGLAAAFSVIGAAITRLIPYRPATERPGAPGPSTLRLAALIDRDVLPVTVLQMILTMGQPAASAFVPLFAQQAGMDLREVGWFFVANGVAAVVGRGPLGRLSDRFGRAPCIAGGFVATGLSFVLLSTATGLPSLIAAGLTYSFGFSSAASAMLALAFDRANPARRGIAMATFSLGTQLGIAAGATLWGALIEVLGYRGMYLAAVGSAALGIGSVLLLTSRGVGRRTAR